MRCRDNYKRPLMAVLFIALLCTLNVRPADAQDFNDGDPNDSNWSTSGNWVGGTVPDGNSAVVRIINGSPVVDSARTVKEIFSGFGFDGYTSIALGGPGPLTIDINSASAFGLRNRSGQGAVLDVDATVIINNSADGPGVRTRANFENSSNNVIAFNGVLDLQTGFELQSATGGAYELNGQLAGVANLFFNTDTITFSATADNAGYDGDLVFFNNSAVVSNITSPGLLLGSGHKIQVNGNSSIEVNGAETFQGNLVLGGANNFTLDADANQSSMGFLEITNGVLTLDVGAAVTELAFADSSERIWGAGSVSIVGFKEDTIRFGADANGLTAGQLAVIDGGIYSLDSMGYLTVGGSSALPGDFNQNGIVDLADYTVWRDNLGSVTALPNDDGLGTPISAAHYGLWKSQFGTSNGLGALSAAAVPEPASVVLTLVGLLAVCQVKPRRSRDV